MKEWIWGRNPIFESLRAGRRQFYELRIAQGIQANERLDQILKLAKSAKLPITQVKRETLNVFSDHHQGIALQVNKYHM